MRFPVIKVKDKYTNSVEIVGTNSHHELYVDEETGGIQFLHLQCMAGTKKIDGKSSDCEFVGNEPDEYQPYVTVEFVTIEDLIKIAIENMKEQTEIKLKIEEIFKEYQREVAESKEKLKGTIPDTSGMLPY